MLLKVRISLNNEDNRNFFPQLESKLELYHVVLTSVKFLPEKNSLTAVEIQKLTNIE